MNKELYKEYDGIKLAKLVKASEVTKEELIKLAIEVATESNRQFNYLSDISEDVAKYSCLNSGSGVFEGVPFLVKELFPYPGLKTTYGSNLFRNNIEEVWTVFPKKILENGFQTFGNTTSSEFALLGSSETRLHGITKNPWNSEYSVGGSSGGSAAAVASRCVPLAHASDGGGSTRYPASVCGLIGFKPTNGRCMSSTPKSTSFGSLVVDSCISRSVRDSAFFVSCIERENDLLPFHPEKQGSKRLKIGVYRETLIGSEIDKEVNSALDKTIIVLKSLGHTVFETKLPKLNGKAISNAFYTTAGSLINEMVRNVEGILGIHIDTNQLEPFTYSLIRWFRNLDKSELEKAVVVFEESKECIKNFASDFDVLLCPTLAKVPQKLGYLSPNLPREELIKRTEEYIGFTPIHNISGMPSVSLPMFVSGGLPIGMLFSAQVGDDNRLIQLAYELEEFSFNQKL